MREKEIKKRGDFGTKNKMTAACQNGQPDFRISIVSETELLYHDLCKNTYTQKKVTLGGGDVDDSFTFVELKNLGAMLHDSTEFKSDQFKPHTGLIVNLGKVLVRDDMTRSDLVTAMLAIMKVWLQVCKDDARCILPTALDNMKDPNQQKQAALVSDLQNTVKELLTEMAMKVSPTKFSPEQQQLVDAASRDLLLRKL